MRTSNWPSHFKGEGGLSSLAIAMQAIEKASRGDTSLIESYERLDSIYVETQDLVTTFRERLSSITFSQERLDALQGRQAQLQRLKKKYGPTLSMVIAYRDEVVDKLSQSEGMMRHKAHPKDSAPGRGADTGA